MSKHITMKMWEEVGDFTKIAYPRDTVDEEIVDQFMNSVPPESLWYGYLQAGEAYDLAMDEETGRWKNTYTTFCKSGDTWTFAGYCFKGKSEHKEGYGDPWRNE